MSEGAGVIKSSGETVDTREVIQQPHFVLFGIPVRIGGGALILSAIAVMIFGSTGFGIAVAFIGSILMHELGHAFAFRRYGATSAISIHGLGGMTVSYDAHRLTHGQHVIVSAAGPLVQLLLLGLPALAVSLFMPVTGVASTILTMMIFINIGWAFVNLLPLYPLDGGQILYHSLSHRGRGNAWGITKMVAIGLGAPLALLAFRYYPIGALLIGYTIYQGINSPPASAGIGGTNPIRDAAARARSQHQPVTAKGSNATSIIDDAHQQLAAGSPRRFEMLVSALEQSGSHEQPVAGLRAWASLLDGDHDAQHPSSSIFQATRGAAFAPSPPAGSAPETAQLRTALVSPESGSEALVAAAVLHRQGRLDVVLTGATSAELTDLADRCAVAGILNEQMAIRRLVQH